MLLTSIFYHFTGSAIAAHIEVRKDVFCRLKNNVKICWRMIHWMFVLKFIKIALSQGENNDEKLLAKIQQELKSETYLPMKNRIKPIRKEKENSENWVFPRSKTG